MPSIRRSATSSEVSHTEQSSIIFSNVFQGHKTVVLVCCTIEWEPYIPCTWEVWIFVLITTSTERNSDFCYSIVASLMVKYQIVGAHTHTETHACTHAHTHVQVVVTGWHAQLAANLLFTNNIEIFQYRTPNNIEIFQYRTPERPWARLLYNWDKWNITWGLIM